MKKPMKGMSYELSDALRDLGADLRQFEQGGLTLDGDTVRDLTARLKHWRALAQELEWEISAHRWNALAVQDRAQLGQDVAALEAAIAAPGSNVSLFPVIPRPCWDGRCHTPGAG